MDQSNNHSRVPQQRRPVNQNYQHTSYNGVSPTYSYPASPQPALNQGYPQAPYTNAPPSYASPPPTYSSPHPQNYSNTPSTYAYPVQPQSPPAFYNSNIHDPISPVASPVSSPPHFYSKMSPEVTCVEALTPGERENLPNWKPKWMDRGPYYVLFAIIIILATYIAMYVWGNHNGSIAPSRPGIDEVFRFGPVLAALLVAIMVDRIAEDVASVFPFIALSSSKKSHLRKQYAARLTEPSRNDFFKSLRPSRTLLPHKFRKWFQLATLWCVVVLVPGQSALFNVAPRIKGMTSSTFRVLGLPELMDSVFQSEFPKAALEAVWHGQKVSDFKWITFMEQENRTNAQWGTLMPFRPDEEGMLKGDAGTKWQSKTSLIYSNLACKQINSLSVTASTVAVNGDARSAKGVKVSVEDENGCSLSWSWDTVSSSDTMGPGNPFDLDGRFAFVGSGCESSTYIFVSGPLALMSSQDFSAEGGSDSPWGAISCRSRYMAYLDSASYTIVSIGLQDKPNYELDYDASLVDVTAPDDTTHSLVVPMDNLVLNSSAMYDISSPFEQMTFWGKPQDNTFKDYFALSGLPTTCASLSSTAWDNEQACKMYIAAADIWSFVVVVSAASTALYVPVGRWNITDGSIISTKDGWYLSSFGLLYTIVFYVIVLFFLAMERSLKFGIGIRGKGRNTGLQGSASSIAGLAAVFQDPSTRRLFEGVDSLNSKDALDVLRQSVDTRNLQFQLGRDTNGWAVVKPIVQTPYEPGPLAPLTSNAKDLQKLRYGNLPLIYHMCVPMFIVSGAIIGVVFKFLILSSKSSFYIWPQDAPIDTRHFDPTNILYQIQRLLWAGLPTLAISLFGLWWGEIDKFLRRTQPYSALGREGGDTGQKTVLLDYMHDWHIEISIKAFKNRHWKLFYVTCVTFGMKIATLLAAGIFVMALGPTNRDEMLKYRQSWREGTFLENSTTAFAEEVKNVVVSRAIYAYPQLPGWQTGGYFFPAVELKSKNTTVPLQGVLGGLDCSSIAVSTSIGNGGGWNAEIKEGVCKGTVWPSICDLSSLPSSGDKNTVPRGQCMSWRYIDGASCSGLGPVDTGRWWIFGLNGSIDGTTQTLTQSSTPLSLMCTPTFSLQTTNVNVAKTNTSEPVINIRGITASQQLAKDHWKNADGKDFASYISEFMNQTFAGDLQVVSYSTYLDLFSAIMALNMTQASDDLFNADTLARGASQTFSTIFATMVGMDQSGNGNGTTCLLQPVEDAERAPTVLASPSLQVAEVRRVPLWIGTIIMCIFCVSIPFAWPSGSRRTPHDIAYPANVVSMIYDSSLVDLVKNAGPGQLDILGARKFAIGIYTAPSTNGKEGEKKRIGIDVVQKVERIGRRSV